MSQTQHTGEQQDEGEGQGSALRIVIMRSRLTITRAKAWSPFATERWNLSDNAQKLLDDFETLKDKLQTFDDKLQAASDAVRQSNAGRADTARSDLERLTQSDVGSSDSDRAARQKKIDDLIKLVDGFIGKVDEAVAREQQADQKRIADTALAKQQLEEDQQLVAEIGDRFDALQATYGDKLEKERNARINGLRAAFADVTSGKRPLTGQERSSATTLRDTDGAAWEKQFADHATLIQRMASEQALQVPEGATSGESSKLESQRRDIDKLLAARPVTDGNVKTATEKVDALASAVQVTAEAIAARRKEIQDRSDRRAEILRLLQTDAYTVPEGAEGNEGDGVAAKNQAVANALPNDPPSAQELKRAEQLLVDLGKAAQQLGDIIAERQRQAAARGQRRGEILALLTTDAYAIPAGATGPQTQALGLGHTAITNALRDDPPSPGALQTAETALTSLGTDVAQAKRDIAEAAAALQRKATLQERWGNLDFRTFGPLLGKDTEYRESRKGLDPLFAPTGPAALSANQFATAEAQIATIERLIDERVADFEGEQQGFRTWLATFNYLAGEITKVRRKDTDLAADFEGRYQRLQAQVGAGLRLTIGLFDDRAKKSVDDALTDLSALAIEIADALNPPTGPATTFDWQDPGTWDVQPIRYAGNGTAGYCGGLSGADPGMLGRIAGAGVGDRHSGAKIITGKPMHQHTDNGSGGISFAYGHLGGNRVEPVIYDYASKRNGNTYQWENDAPSNGPSGLPATVRARV